MCWILLVKQNLIQEKKGKKNQMTEHPQPEFLDGNTTNKCLPAVDGTEEKVWQIDTRLQ